MSMICRIITASLLTATMALGQVWSCPDDGTSTTIVSNTGTGNESYVFAVTPEIGYDNSLRIQVFDLDDPSKVITEVELVSGTTPTVTIGPNQGIRITDPNDADSLAGKGTYRSA